jgi:hypothetical protein
VPAHPVAAMAAVKARNCRLFIALCTPSDRYSGIGKASEAVAKDEPSELFAETAWIRKDSTVSAAVGQNI